MIASHSKIAAVKTYNPNGPERITAFFAEVLTKGWTFGQWDEFHYEGHCGYPLLDGADLPASMPPPLAEIFYRKWANESEMPLLSPPAIEIGMTVNYPTFGEGVITATPSPAL